MKNIVLIGLPGSGKTSVGALAAQALGLPLVDTDRLVEQREGMTIAQLFAQKGEAYFRQAEHEAAVEAASMSGAVIATGGGLVLRRDSMEALARTGVICFLDRSPQDILKVNHQARPLLSQDPQRIFTLYRERLPHYQKWAQITVPVGSSPQETARALLDALEGRL